MTYFFSMLRFVPDPGRGEFINLGAIAGDDETGDWELRLISTLTRAKAIDDAGLLPAALSFAGELEERIASEDEAEGGLDLNLLEHLAVDMNNVVQFTAPSRIAAPSATEALDAVFEHKVMDPAAKEFRFAKKFPAVKATGEAYRHHEVPPEAIKRRARVAADRFFGKFDFAVHNGQVVQLAHCWSFQLPNQTELADQIKSWAWVVHELRENGGELAADDGRFEIPSNLEVAVVYVPPKPETESPAFREAQAAFEETNVRFLPSEDADVIGARAAELLGSTTVD